MFMVEPLICNASNTPQKKLTTGEETRSDWRSMPRQTQYRGPSTTLQKVFPATAFVKRKPEERADWNRFAKF